MGWLGLLNPMNWLKILSLVSTIISMISKGVEAYQNAQRKKADEKRAVDNAAKLKKALEEGDDEKIERASNDLLNGN